MPDINSPLLEQIDDPTQLRQLSPSQLKQLAKELREFMIASVAHTGGHLSSGLGTVELTIALHYVYNTPEDRVVWDVGHQSYPHKILTGRRERMATLRQFEGLAGFPKRDESPYDTFGTGHSSTSISWISWIFFLRWCLALSFLQPFLTRWRLGRDMALNMYVQKGR